MYLAAMLALRPLGEAAAPALPRLIEMMPDEDGEWDEFEEDGDAIAEAVAWLGPAAVPAVPALMRLGNYYDDEADEALVAIGPAAVAAMLEEVGRRGREAIDVAVSALRRLAEGALPTLLSALRDGEEAVREAAALALIRQAPEAAVPVLLAELEAGREHWRDEARLADAIEEAAPYAPPPAEVLGRLLPGLRQSAAGTIAGVMERLGEAGGAIRILCGLLGHASAERRTAAVSALGNMDELPDDALSAIIPLLDDGEKEVRDAARMALSGGRVAARGLVRRATLAAARGRHADVATWALIQMAGWEGDEWLEGIRGGVSAASPEVRRQAIILLHGRAEAAVLLGALIDDDAGVRGDAADALAEAGPADGVTAGLRAALGDDAPGVRMAVLRAAAIRGEDFVAEALRMAADDPAGEVRAAALDFLSMCGLPDGEVIGLLRGRLGDEGCADTAAHRLADLADGGADIGEAVPELVPLVGRMGNGAARALAAAGAAAVPALIGVLNGGDGVERREACRALEDMGEAAAPAADALLGVLADADLAEEAAKTLAVCAMPGTAAGPLTQLLMGHNANTTEYALTALGRIGPGGAAWSDCVALLDHGTDDVAACAVWVAGRLLPLGVAVELWRGWLASGRYCVKLGAHLELFRAGLMEAPKVEDLFAAAIVFGLRPAIADIIAPLAAGDEEAYREVLSAATRSHHGRHGTAVEVLRRVGMRDADRTADALDSSFSACSERGWGRTVLRALWEVGPAVPMRVLPRLRTLCV